VHACVHADGSIVGLSPQFALQSGLPFCVQAFCAVDAQFSSHLCWQVFSGAGVAFGCAGCTTGFCSGVTSCGAFTCASSGCSIVFGAVGAVSTTGFVVTSCAIGAQLMRINSASMNHFISLNQVICNINLWVL